MYRVCKICEQNLPLESFYRNGERYHKARCISCMRVKREIPRLGEDFELINKVKNLLEEGFTLKITAKKLNISVGKLYYLRRHKKL